MRFCTDGVCAKTLDVELEGDRIGKVSFHGGCQGYSKALPAVLRGMKAAEAVKRLKGIRCGMRGTSCADQLARAVEIMLRKNKTK